MNTKKAIQSRSANRSPNGCTAQTLLMLRPEERETINKLAAADGRTVSAMGRILLLKGIEAHGIKEAC